MASLREESSREKYSLTQDDAITLKRSAKPKLRIKITQKLTRATGLQVAAATLRVLRKKPDPRELLKDLLEGPELTMSTHVRRMDDLLVAMNWKSAEDGHRYSQLSVEAIRANAASSEAIANQIYRKVAPKAAHKHKRVIDTLHARTKVYLQYSLATAEGGKPLRVLVAGGGPVGLRAAIEVAQMGHRVTVIEPRDECTRLNVLKLWEESVSDLDRYALNLIDSHYSNGRDARASTSRLQLALLKAALLLGVHVVVDPNTKHRLDSLTDAKGYDVLLHATGFNRQLLARFASQSDVRASGGGGGGECKPFEEMPAPDRQSTAIAVVAHFEYSERTAESAEWMRAFEAFDWTVQDALGADDPERLLSMQKRFGLYCVPPKQLEADGLHLENVVCYRNKGANKKAAAGKLELGNVSGVPPSFYFIFTLRSQHVEGLVQLKPGDTPPSTPRDLLLWAKKERRLSDAEVDNLAKRVVAHFTRNYTSMTRKGARGGAEAEVSAAGGSVQKPLSEACKLLRELEPQMWKKSCDVFDFSERKCMRSAAEVVGAIDGGSLGDAPLLVLPVGDALQEPFWPEGLGVNRGFHNAMDAAWITNKWALAQRGTPADHAALVAERQSLYQQFTLQMHGKNRSMLRGYRTNNTRVDGSQAHKNYSADPASRYRTFADTIYAEWASKVPARQSAAEGDVRRGK